MNWQAGSLKTQKKILPTEELAGVMQEEETVHKGMEEKVCGAS